MWKATITVTLRPSILDPQGSAVVSSLKSMGYDQVQQVRVGKHMELVVKAPDRGEAERLVREVCDRLLANPVIEDYHFELMEG